MTRCWLVLAVLTVTGAVAPGGCTDTEEGNIDAAVTVADAGLTPAAECDRYLICVKAVDPAHYDEELALFKAGSSCWSNKDNCVKVCESGYNTLAAKHTTVPACGGTLPDGGLDKGPDLSSAQPTGSSCSKDSDCQGNKCLTTVEDQGTTLTMSGGYCSRDCATALCKTAEACFSSTNKLGKVLGKYCLRSCSSPNDCRTGEGYTCSSHSVCLPGSATDAGAP